jgi:hypothetical protein
MLSSLWKTLSKRADDIARLLWRRAASFTHLDLKIIHDHVLAAHRAPHSLCQALRIKHGEEFRGWARSLSKAIDLCSEHFVKSLATVANVKAKRLQDLVARARSREWKVAVGASVSEGAIDRPRPTRLAYRWVKGIAGWTSSPMGSDRLHDSIPDEADDGELELEHPGLACAQMVDGEDLAMPLADQAAVDQEAESWAMLWQETKDYAQPSWADLEEQLPLLSDWAIRTAAASFPAGTGLGCDNISPRALLRLSAGALHALAALFMAFERRGDWCEVFNLVLIVLLPKTDGGLRPIGLFPTVIRIWMRTRMCVARAWEAANSLPSLYGGVGMGAQRAAWQAAFVAELATFEEEEHAQTALDLVKAFETVPHEVLVQAAIDKGYPLVLLRLSLAAYRLRRTVGIDGVFSRTIIATRGITAGGGFATTELRVLLIGLVESLHIRWTCVIIIRLYVDDLTLAVCGLPKFVVATMAAVIDYTVHWLEDLLLMEVSAKKSRVVASKPALAAAIVERTKTCKVSPTCHLKLLGTDSVGGARRSTLTAQSRVGDLTSRSRRYRALRASGVNSAQMVRTAATPAVMYGCDIFGIADSPLNTVRAKIARAGAPEAAGKNPDLMLSALDGQDGTMDPAFEAHGLPIKHWAFAWWEEWATPVQLAQAFRGAVDKLVGKRSHWQAAAGPSTALVLTVIRLGWTMPSPSQMLDDLGTPWDMRLDSPEAIVRAAHRSVRRWRLSRVAQVLPRLVPDRPDYGDPKAQETILIDFSYVTAPMVKGKGSAKKGTASWDPRHKGDLLSAMSNGQWPQARKATVPSWHIDDSRCQLCLAEVGTLEHRLKCKAIRPAEGWPAAPKAARKALSLLSLQPSRLNLLWTKARLVIKLPAPRSQHEGDFTWLVDPTAHPHADSATWYFDGSMLQGKWFQLRVTGFGIVVVHQGSLLGYGFGSPPHWCLTAAAAEAWALATVLKASPTIPQMKTDCLSLIRAAESGSKAATAAKRPLARIWKGVGHTLDADINQIAKAERLGWVPAHQSLGMIGEKQLPDGTRLTAVDWRANRLADALAKRGAARFALPKDAQELLASGAAAVRYAAGILGRATWGANNCKVTKVDEQGNSSVVTVRDATPAPRVYATKAAAEPKAPKPPPPPKVFSHKAWVEPKTASAAVATRKRRREASEERLRTRVQDIGESMRLRSGQSAVSRIAALRSRVLGND